MNKSATLSPCGKYRYTLERSWDHTARNGAKVCFIMLNPSTADDTRDDQTIGKCIRFARKWGYGSIQVVNLYAFRTVSPRKLRQHFVTDGLEAIKGPQNERFLMDAVLDAGIVVAAWGTHTPEVVTAIEITRIIQPFAKCLGVNAGGSPKHPLYLSSESPLVPYP